MILLLISSGVTMSVPFFIGKLIDFIQTNDKELLKERLKYIWQDRLMGCVKKT